MLRRQLTVQFLLALIAAVVLTVGCRGEVDLGTTPSRVDALSTPLTIETRWYGQQRNLGGVTVTLDAMVVGVTDGEGRLDIEAPTGREIVVGVDRPPYVAMVPWVGSTLQPHSHERWIFFFELAP